MIKIEQEGLMRTLTQIQPHAFDQYCTLVEAYLRQEKKIFQEKYNAVPEHFKKVLKNNDIQKLTLRLLGEDTELEEPPEDEELRDDQLKRKIDQYNKIAKPVREREKHKGKRSRRYSDSEDGKSKRKTRTTITPAKLEEMNRIFKEYIQRQEKLKEQSLFDIESQGITEMSSLKSIGEKLGLGYSTILHKFRQFRATKKVKGGALIAAINQKRKYKKSKEIEELIQKSLREGSFYTAVELAKYIETKYNKTLSRSIISRHLGEMGYSYKNIKSKPFDKNSYKIKILRKNFATALILLRNKYLSQVYYLDQYVFSLADMPRKPVKGEKEEYLRWQHDGELNLTILASAQGIVKFEIRNVPMMKQEFQKFLVDSQELLCGSTNNCQIIIMDMDNPIHYSDEVMQIRKRMHSRNIKLFYLPPYSQQMSTLEWLFPSIKENLMLSEYETLDELKVRVEESLKALCSNSLEAYFREAETYIAKSLTEQNFD